MDKAVIKQQAFAWPPVPHQLKNLIPPLNPTVVKELVTSRQLESNMSPTQYRNWRTQLQSNSDFFTKFLTKHPSVDEPFLTALYNGVVFQSEAQVVATQKLVKKLLEQNAVVFQPMKSSPSRLSSWRTGTRVRCKFLLPSGLPSARELLPPDLPTAREFPTRLAPRRRRIF